MLPDKRITLLLAAFGRALSHQVRTPLSVISNDLFYLQTLINPEECQRSLERCKSISDILTASCRLNAEPPQIAPMELATVFSRYFAVRSEGVAIVVGDRDQLSVAFSMLADLLGAASDRQLPLEIESNDVDVIVRISPPPQLLEIEEDQLKFASFTELYNISGLQDSFAPIFVDAVLWEHGADSRIECAPTQPGLNLNISIYFEAYRE